MSTDQNAGPMAFRKLNDPGWTEGVEDRLVGIKADLGDRLEKLSTLEGEVKEKAFEEAESLMFQSKRLAIAEKDLRYPHDIPNVACQHARLTGVAFENCPVRSNEGDTVVTNYLAGQLIPLLRFGGEEIFLWDCSHNETHQNPCYLRTVMVSQVPVTIKNERLWITFLSCLKLAMTIVMDYESVWEEGTYAWMYYFDPSISPKEQRYGRPHDDAMDETGRILRYGELFNHFAVLELLLRDELYFIACQQLLASYQAHWFCTICALSPEPCRMHDHQEPECWEQAEAISKLDVATVQATRAVEALIGEPGSMKTPSDIFKMKTKWTARFNLDPDAPFEMSGMTYLGYYDHLYDAFRNPAAHGRRSIPYNLKRENTVKIQCFAFLLLNDYLVKNRVSIPDAAVRLEFNMDVLRQRDQIALSRLSESDQP